MSVSKSSVMFEALPPVLIDRLQVVVRPAKRKAGIGGAPLNLGRHIVRPGHDGLGYFDLYENVLGPGIDAKLYCNNGSRGYRGLVVSANGLRLLRQDLQRCKVYPLDAPVGYQNSDNFIDRALLSNPSVVTLFQRRHLELLLPVLERQRCLADVLIPNIPKQGLPSDGIIRIAQVEFVYDLCDPLPHALLKAIEPRFFQLPTQQSSFKQEGNALILFAALRDGVRLTIYTKAPQILRLQLKLTGKGLRAWLGRESTIPLTVEAWTSLLTDVDTLFRPLAADLFREQPSSADAQARLALLTLLAQAQGNSSPAYAREFLSPLLLRGAVANEKRRFRGLVRRAKAAGLIERRGRLWTLAERHVPAVRGLLGIGGGHGIG